MREDGADWVAGDKNNGSRQRGDSLETTDESKSFSTNPTIRLFNSELTNKPREFILLLKRLPEIICELEYNDLVVLRTRLEFIVRNFATHESSSQIYHNKTTYQQTYLILVENINLLNLRISELETNSWVIAPATIYDSQYYSYGVQSEQLLSEVRQNRERAQQEQNSIESLTSQLKAFKGCKKTDLFRNTERLSEIVGSLDNQIDSITLGDLHILYNLLSELIKEFDEFTSKTATVIKAIESLRHLKIKINDKYNERSESGARTQHNSHGKRRNHSSKIRLIS